MHSCCVAGEWCWLCGGCGSVGDACGSGIGGFHLGGVGSGGGACGSWWWVVVCKVCRWCWWVTVVIGVVEDQNL